MVRCEERSAMETKSSPAGSVPTHTIEAKLSDDDLRRLDERARDAGIDRAECAGLLIRKGLEPAPAGSELPHARKTIDEIFAPVHREFAESGMTEEELYLLLEEAREEVWQEKQRAKGDK
jgi:hypothetical protein